MPGEARPHHAAWFAEDRGAALQAARRYGLSLAVVLTVLAGVLLLGRSTGPSSHDVAEPEDVTMVDLPPEQVGGGGTTEPTASAPPPVAPQPPPVAVPRESPPQPPPPPAPNPAVALPENVAAPVPPVPVAAPAAAADAAPGAEVPKHHASARSVTAWQRSLMKSLLRAEGHVRRPAYARGTVRVAFTLDRNGGLADVRVATTSGAPDLDALAVKFVRDAAPYPKPPPGTDAADLAFIVPVIVK